MDREARRVRMPSTMHKRLRTKPWGRPSSQSEVDGRPRSATRNHFVRVVRIIHKCHKIFSKGVWGMPFEKGIPRRVPYLRKIFLDIFHALCYNMKIILIFKKEP